MDDEKMPEARNGSKDLLAKVTLVNLTNLKDQEITSSQQQPSSSQDEAVQWLSSHGGLARPFNANEDARLLRKIDKQ